MWIPSLNNRSSGGIFLKDYINASDFKEMILCAEEALLANIQLINELNVFPVPDGDTGTNMCLTMQNAADELRKKDFSTVEEASACVANALLRGARGNSGVILSLLFRGISKRLKGLETAGTAEFAGALQDGVDAAYKAVMKPAEGTILTVSRLASAAACEAAKLGSDLEGMFICALKAGNKALIETTNQNPVLKKAGVVDAGGKGYIVILNAIFSSLRGEVKSSGEAPETVPEQESATPFDAFSSEDITYAYDTVFIVRKSAEDEDLAPFRAYLGSIGDSLVIGESDDSFKVHVHTNDPGDVLRESGKYGTLELAKIENMRMQHDDLLANRKPRSTDDLSDDDSRSDLPDGSGSIAAPEKEFGVVTVCAGAGMESLFRELGADAVVTGGQTMNPSTADILKAINQTPASTVFVLPNNKNIIMAAEQCIPLTEKTVIVIPTKTIPQGITALLNFDPDSDPETLTSAMTECLSSVHTAMVTYAARDSDFDGHTIHAGEYLALLDGALLGSYTNIKTLFKEMCWSFDEFSPDFITVYYGENVEEAGSREVLSTISGVFPDAEVKLINGGQPVYYYIIGIE